jgi:hypothetical protein
MVGHQTVREDAHRQSLAGALEESHESFIVPVLMKDARTTVAAVKDVVAVVGLGGPSGAWHIRANLTADLLVSNKKSRMSPFPFS